MHRKPLRLMQSSRSWQTYRRMETSRSTHRISIMKVCGVVHLTLEVRVWIILRFTHRSRRASLRVFHRRLRGTFLHQQGRPRHRVLGGQERKLALVLGSSILEIFPLGVFLLETSLLCIPLLCIPRLPVPLLAIPPLPMSLLAIPLLATSPPRPASGALLGVDGRVGGRLTCRI
jgi:hypothetical protein